MDKPDPIHRTRNAPQPPTLPIQAGLSSLAHAEDINTVLFEIASAVNTTLNLNDLYRSIHRSLARIIDVTNFFIAIVDPAERTLYFPYHVDTEDDDFQPITDFDTDGSLTGFVVHRKKPALLRRTELENRAQRKGIWGPVPLIWMGVPLIVNDVVIGVIALQSYTNPDIFTDQDLQVLSAVSHQTAIAIDRKRSHDELRESEKRFRLLFDQSNDAIILHCDGQIVDVNHKACQMLGFSADALIGRHMTGIESGRRPSSVESRYDKVISGQALTFETEWVNADGVPVPVEVSTRIADAKKGIVQSIGRDITERKQLEAQLLQSQRMESIGLLAGGVAHDLNNVLSGIVGYPDLILMEMAAGDPLREKIERIKNSGLKAAEIVQDLLTLARRGVKPSRPW